MAAGTGLSRTGRGPGQGPPPDKGCSIWPQCVSCPWRVCVAELPAEEARAAGRALAPTDAQLTRTYMSRTGRIVDLYRSTSLRAQFPTSPWLGGEPGDLIVIYRQTPAGRVTSIVVALGNNP